MYNASFIYFVHGCADSKQSLWNKCPSSVFFLKSRMSSDPYYVLKLGAFLYTKFSFKTCWFLQFRYKKMMWDKKICLIWIFISLLFTVVHKCIHSFIASSYNYWPIRPKASSKILSKNVYFNVLQLLGSKKK